MPIDNYIPRQDAAPAGFATESYAGPLEPLFDASAEVIDIDVPYVLAATTDLKELSVVNYDPATKAITLATVTAGESNANAILAQPLQGDDTDTGRVAIHTSGHWNSRALIWHATFNTDELKETAFFASERPMIRVSTPKFSADAIDIPN